MCVQVASILKKRGAMRFLPFGSGHSRTPDGGIECGAPSCAPTCNGHTTLLGVLPMRFRQRCVLTVRSLFLVFVLVAACAPAPLDLPNASAPGTTSPPLPPCDSLDHDACAMRADCEVASCPKCGGQIAYGCLAAGSPPPQCPVAKCSCEAFTDETSCDAASGCIAVYVSPPCGCDQIGCCMHYDHCADTVQCFPDAHPACPPTPGCKPGYSLAYDGGCAIGCVADAICVPGD
jgi:hypothetical protein